eukprot:262689_1
MSSYALKLARRISKRYGITLQRISKWKISINAYVQSRAKYIKNSNMHHRDKRYLSSSNKFRNKNRYFSSSGLAGVIVCDSVISTVGHKGAGLTYYGYSINDLALNCQFEEIAYLLTRNRLPNRQELNEYIIKLNKYYNEIPINLLKTLELMPKTSHPMDVLK